MSDQSPNSPDTGPPDALQSEAPAAQRKPRLGLYLVGALVLLGAGVYAGMTPRIAQRKAVVAETAELAIRTFATVNPSPSKPPEPLTLSAELKPIIETPLY